MFDLVVAEVEVGDGRDEEDLLGEEGQHALLEVETVGLVSFGVPQLHCQFGHYNNYPFKPSKAQDNQKQTIT